MASKPWKAVILSVVATSLVWIFGLVALLLTDRHLDRLREMSNVIAPMGVLIDDLNETARQERYDVLRLKLRALDERWEAYRRREVRPCDFCWTIRQIGEEHAKQAPHPAAGGNG